MVEFYYNNYNDYSSNLGRRINGLVDEESETRMVYYPPRHTDTRALPERPEPLRTPQEEKAFKTVARAASKVGVKTRPLVDMATRLLSMKGSPGTGEVQALAALYHAAEILGDYGAMLRIASAECEPGVPCMKDKKNFSRRFKRALDTFRRLSGKKPIRDPVKFLESMISSTGLIVPAYVRQLAREVLLAAKPLYAGRRLRSLAAGALVIAFETCGIPSGKKAVLQLTGVSEPSLNSFVYAAYNLESVQKILARWRGRC